jgi:hypothetical protein
MGQLKQRFALGKITKEVEPELFSIFEAKKYRYHLIKSFPCANVDELRAEREK